LKSLPLFNSPVGPRAEQTGRDAERWWQYTRHNVPAHRFFISSPSARLDKQNPQRERLEHEGWPVEAEKCA
jgi:hypothetical protein